MILLNPGEKQRFQTYRISFPPVLRSIRLDATIARSTSTYVYTLIAWGEGKRKRKRESSPNTVTLPFAASPHAPRKTDTVNQKE